MSTPSAFGARLAELRGRKGLTQSQLAALAGLHTYAVVKIERGQRAWPRLDTVLALARALGTAPGKLVDGLD